VEIEDGVGILLVFCVWCLGEKGGHLDTGMCVLDEGCSRGSLAVKVIEGAIVADIEICVRG
jgi:hypothetical protein